MKWSALPFGASPAQFKPQHWALKVIRVLTGRINMRTGRTFDKGAGPMADRGTMGTTIVFCGLPLRMHLPKRPAPNTARLPLPPGHPPTAASYPPIA